jgi:hypothetical protein
MGELHKIKWNRNNIITIPHIFHMLLIRCNAKLLLGNKKHDANRYMDGILIFFIFF